MKSLPLSLAMLLVAAMVAPVHAQGPAIVPPAETQAPAVLPPAAAQSLAMVPDKTFFYGESVIVAVASDGHKIWAYSVETGKWKGRLLPATEMPIQPVLRGPTVTLQVRDRVLAFSALTGSWDDVKVPVGLMVDIRHLRDDLAMFEVGASVYAYSAKAGKWDELEEHD
jgi:hypothetical protein